MATAESINARLTATLAPYEAQLNKAKAENDRQKAILKRENDRALQEAYIQSRQARKALPQQLAAQGLHGGLAETSHVRLQNNYQNARNQLDRGYQEGLADLNLSYYNTQQDINAKIAAAKAQAQAELAELAARQAAARRYGGGTPTRYNIVYVNGNPVAIKSASNTAQTGKTPGLTQGYAASVTPPPDPDRDWEAWVYE